MFSIILRGRLSGMQTEVNAAIAISTESMASMDADMAAMENTTLMEDIAVTTDMVLMRGTAHTNDRFEEHRFGGVFLFSKDRYKLLIESKCEHDNSKI